MPKPLWDKGEKVDERMRRLTVGDDPVLDLELVPFDCLGSAAHARMLASIGVLTEDEADRLVHALATIIEQWRKGEFEIAPEEEDCHTAIERELTRLVGDAGKKIHTGRSRNDQVLLAVRLYLRDRALKWIDSSCALADAFLSRRDELGTIPMPGYTHLQPAMPSSLGLWLHAFVEGCLDLVRQGFRLLDSLDECPLGSAAGFGVPLTLDRVMTARLLGFARPQRSVVDIQNSRGRHEGRFLAWACEIATLLEKFACDLSLLLTREFGFFRLPVELTTGSSIMPQKHNPDLAELLRGRAARVRGAASELAMVAAKLPSNYHRDLQYTKEPLFRAVRETEAMMEIAVLLVEGIRPDEDRLRAAMTDEIYVTYQAYRLLGEGMPFREAYREAARLYAEGAMDMDALRTDFEIVREQSDSEAREAIVELAELRDKKEATVERLRQTERLLMGVV
ncbi:MAG: argininosuccinate lyase [Fimbriimonadia bacterium]|jgi:argininosuccinate lyase